VKNDKRLQIDSRADGFDFNGYDTLFIAATGAKVTPHNDEEAKLLEWAKRFLRDELVSDIQAKKVFATVVTEEADIKPGGKTLKLENTIIEYEKGGGGARFWTGGIIGLATGGAGQPIIKVQGKISDGDKPILQFTVRRSGDSIGAKVSGGTMNDKSIQMEDILGLSKDVADFIGRTSQHQPGI
jgi:hypothetical protein